MNINPENDSLESSDKETKKVQAILTAWDPLGSRSKSIADLDDYFTEANDILFHIEMGLNFPKVGPSQKRVVNIIKSILNEAFDLSLTDADCQKPAEEILAVTKLNKS